MKEKDPASNDVTGLVVVRGMGRSSASQSLLSGAPWQAKSLFPMPSTTTEMSAVVASCAAAAKPADVGHVVADLPALSTHPGA